MQATGCKLGRAAALLIAVITGFASIAWAGGRWKVGDVIVCFGDGTCQVVRPGTAPAVTLLDTINDYTAFTPEEPIVSNPGNTFGVAINNSLHLLVTDAGDDQANVVEYQIAGIDPLGNPVSHGVSTVFNSTGVGDIQAVALDNAGDMFILNGSPEEIAELDQYGNPKGSAISLSTQCSGISSVVSMDLSFAKDQSGNALYAYVTAGGVIWQVTVSNQANTPFGNCTPFANFGSGEPGYANEVQVYGIKDIPAGALTGQNCNGVACPVDETILVVAKGFIDAGGNNSPLDTDAVNICTNVVDNTPVSCALLLDTSVSDPSPALPLWQAAQPYSGGTKIQDPHLDQQTVLTAGKSGADEPTFNETSSNNGGLTLNGVTIDNAVVWTDIAQPSWHMNNPYTVAGTAPAPNVAAVNGTFFVDPNGNLETVSVPGTSGSVEPNSPHAMTANPVSWSITGSTTIDGLQWQDLGYWIPTNAYLTVATVPYYAPGTVVGDSAGHVHTVLTAGTSGSGLKPAGTAANTGWNDVSGTNGGITAAGVTIDNAVVWTDIAQPSWHMNNPYTVAGTAPAPNVAAVNGAFFVDPNGNLETVSIPGTSGPIEPGMAGNPVSWSMSMGGLTIDGLQWQDQGAWLAGHLFTGTTVVVADTAGHLHYVQTPGTSGGTQPTWVDPGTTRDNAVRWTDRGSWQPNTTYPTAGGLQTVGDTNSHLWLATAAPPADLTGISGPNPPNFVGNEGGAVIDGFQWMLTESPCTGAEVGDWTPTTPYPQGTLICELTTGVQWAAATSGTSGNNRPSFTVASPAGDDAVTWADQGSFAWQANHPYAKAASLVDHGGIVVDPTGHVQTVVGATDGGTSGPAQPGAAYAPPPSPNPWTDGAPPFGGITIDGLQWTDAGQHIWTPGNPYGVGTLISDQANLSNQPNALAHVQVVYEAGTSGPTMANRPTFNEVGGPTVDNAVTWTESHPTRVPNPKAYVLGAIVLDTFSPVNVQQVTLAGTTGTMPNPFAFSDTGGTAVDGLQWADSGLSVWQHGQLYSRGALISEQSGSYHAQEAYESGTSGPGPGQPTFNEASPPTFTPAVTTIDNAVTWTESNPNPMRAPNQAYVQYAIVLDTFASPIPHVQQVTSTYTYGGGPATGGTTGPGAMATAFSDTSGTVVDGLEWQNQQAKPATAVVARYPVTGQTTLQALALNPLIRNCTSTLPNTCNPFPSPTTSSFWMADSASGDFFNLNFQPSMPPVPPTEYSTTIPQGCAHCTGIQGIGIYGAEDAAQPDLAWLPPGTLTAPSAGGTTTSAQFNFNPNPVVNTDSSNITITGYNFPKSSPAFALNVYASAINRNSGESDFPLLTPAPPPAPPTMAPAEPCTVMTSTGVCVVWQVDNNNVPGTTDMNGNPVPCTSNTCPFLWVAFSQPIVANAPNANNVIDVIDEQYDNTYSVDGTPKRQSEVSLHTVTPAGQETGATCTYGSPLSPNTNPPAACLTESRGNITFKFTCSDLPSGASEANLLPFLRIVQFTSAPSPPNSFTGTEEPFLFLQGTGGTVNYRFDSSGDQWVFNLENPMLGFTPKAKQAQYQACTEDSTHTVETFCTNFEISNSCP